MNIFNFYRMQYTWPLVAKPSFHIGTIEGRQLLLKFHDLPAGFLSCCMGY